MARKLALPEWYERYAKRVENYALPKSEAARQDLASVIAADGDQLLTAIDAATDQPMLAEVPAVLTLRRLWAEQYTGTAGNLRWREIKTMPAPARLLSSPYDTEARYSSRVTRGHLETNALNLRDFLGGHYGRVENFSFRSENKGR